MNKTWQKYKWPKYGCNVSNLRRSKAKLLVFLFLFGNKNFSYTLGGAIVDRIKHYNVLSRGYHIFTEIWY